METNVNYCPFVSLWGSSGEFPVGRLHVRKGSDPNMAVLTVSPFKALSSNPTWKKMEGENFYEDIKE
jgi:hypothetical protein